MKITVNLTLRHVSKSTMQTLLRYMAIIILLTMCIHILIVAI